MAAMGGPPALPGKMTITFFHMGQGDATVIQCPDGKAILVDCGSSRGFTAQVDFIASVYLRHLVPRRRLHALILTHADRDHYNQLRDLLKETSKPAHYPSGSGPDPYVQPAIDVERIYFSDPRYAGVRAARRTSTEDAERYGRYLESLNAGPLRPYWSKSTSRELYKRLAEPHEMALVQLDGADDHVIQWRHWNDAAPRGAPGNQGAERQLTRTGGEVVASGSDWSVRIIAGNVRRAQDDHSDSDGRNAGSLVTLVEAGAWKGLICGDATISTERYLLKHRRVDITDLDVLQVPHHGSGVTSSTPEFVAAVNPKMVVMSVAVTEHKYHLPSRQVVDRYLPRAIRGKRHYVDGWRLAGDYVVSGDNEAYRQYDKWVKEGKYGLDPDRAFAGYTLTPDEASARLRSAGNTPVVVAVQPWRGFLLYRRRTERAVFQTSLGANLTFLTYP